MTEQLAALGRLESMSRDERGVVLHCGAAQVAIRVLAPQIVRVRLAPEGRFLPRRSWSPVRADDQFAEVVCDIQETPSGVQLDTGALRVLIERDSCRISFVDPGGQALFADAAPMAWGPPRAPELPGARTLICTKQLAPAERCYGFGERTGMLNKRGRVLTNWTSDPPSGHHLGTDPLYIAIPVFINLRPGLAYGVYFNNTWRSRFDLGQSDPDLLRLEADGGELDYYLCAGPTPAAVTGQFGALLGTMPLPPKWALGYHQSRWSYGDEATVRRLASEFRARAIPCDAIHLDIDYMRAYRVFTWDTARFPQVAGMIADLRTAGFQVVPIIDPGVKIDPEYPVYQEGVAHDYFIRRANGELFHGYVWPDDSVFADFTRPEVREWWARHQDELVRQGVSGIWNDMNEPTSFDRPFSQGGKNAGTIDLDAPQGKPAERSVHAEVHNVYGSGMAQASYEGLRAGLGGRRPFVLTRSAFAGIQRWSACWMGDNTAWWEHLALTVPQLVGMGLSGVPFVGTDIGGFFGNATPELFARWMQLGALTPFCRGHSCAGTRPAEPWVFGPQVEAICREALQLRYRLLPYLYTLFWQATQSGAPVFRPLLYEFPGDERTYEIDDQVLVGPWLMLAPVTHPGVRARAVYLPAGAWYDWWSGTCVQGPATIVAEAPLERMPMLVRAGAIIPSGPAMQYTTERPLDLLTLDLYPGDGVLTLYEDDGETLAYEQGHYCTTQFSMVVRGHTLEVGVAARAGPFVPAARRVVLRVHQPAGTVQERDYADDGQPHTCTFEV